MMRSVLLVGLLAGSASAVDGEAEKPPAPTVANTSLQVKMETSLGDIVLELDSEKAPVTVENFMRYAQDGFYDGTVFHRVIKTFMIQGGGFTADMEKKTDLRSGIMNEWQNGLKNDRGTISMARLGGNPNSATSQFFINVVDNGRLDHPQRDGAAYAVFGKVVEGMDVVDKIRDAKTAPHPKSPGAGKNAPAETVLIKSVKLVGQYDAKKVTALADAKRKGVEEKAARAGAEKGERANAFKNLLENGEDAEGHKLQKTESGLQYVVIKEGEGPSPKPTEKVKVHYTGWLMDGTKFDSSHDRGKPISFGLNQVIKGWTEGVGLMKVGAKHRLVIPYAIAYGERGTRGIPPKSDLVFDVELLGIE
ncbi:MAG: peptidylprolyl isomerase [bacterium]|nr:peptidylprolyl isomerase [bacterium]